MDNYKKKFDELTSLRSFPKLFIYDYFLNLKSEVDLYFALKQDKQKEYIEMISVIEKIENSTYKNLPKQACMINMYDGSISMLKHLIQNNQFNNLLYKIDLIKYMIEEILLSKISIHFFKEPYLVVLNDVYLRKSIVTEDNPKKHDLFDKYDLTLYLMYKQLNNNLKKTNIIYLNLLCDQIINICYDEDYHKDLYQWLFANYDRNIERHDITYIVPNTFDSFTNLTELKFTNTQISVLDPSTFHKLINLEKIDFSSNCILELHPETFKGLESLEIINFSDNLLTELDPNLFCGLFSLHKLNFNFNLIKEINPNLFGDLESIIEILFESNCLKLLDVNTFHGLNTLKRINLSCNEFNYLDINIFNNLESLGEVDLTKNNIQNYYDFKDRFKYLVDDLESLIIK